MLPAGWYSRSRRSRFETGLLVSHQAVKLVQLQLDIMHTPWLIELTHAASIMPFQYRVAKGYIKGDKHLRPPQLLERPALVSYI